MKKPEYNIIALGVSCFDGMASSTRALNLLEPLIKSNLITVSNLVYESDAKGLLEKKGKLKNINYDVIGFKITNPLSLIKFYWKCLLFIKKNKSSTQKNIIYNFQQIDIKNILILLYAKLIGFKIILDLVEDNAFYTQYPNLFNKFKLKSSVAFLKISPYIAHSIIVISFHLHKKMLFLCKSKIPVTLIPISVNLQFFNLGQTESNPKEIKIFYGGSFGIKDGLEFLIEAFDVVNKEFNNLKLIFSGRGSVSDFKRFEKLVKESLYSEKIIFKGFLEKDEYYALLNECDIFCMSRVDSKFANAGFPFKLGEFLASGKAVVTTTVGDIPIYLTNLIDALLIRPESTVDLVNALKYLICNPEKAKFLGTNARKVVEKNFGSELVSANLFEVFKQASC